MGGHGYLPKQTEGDQIKVGNVEGQCYRWSQCWWQLVDAKVQKFIDNNFMNTDKK